MTSPWLNADQAAEYVGLHVSTVRAAAAAGELSGIKTRPGNAKSQWRFLAKDLDQWLEKGRVGGTKRRAS